MTYAQVGFLAFMWFGIYTERPVFFLLAIAFAIVQILEIISNNRKERIMADLPLSDAPTSTFTPSQNSRRECLWDW